MSPPPQPRAAGLEGGLPLLALLTAASALLALIYCWPAVSQMNEAALGSPDGDGLKHLWTLWWMRYELLELHQLPFATQAINHPYGLELYPIEPLNGLAATLLGFLPLVATANLLAIGNLTLCGVSAGLLGRELGGNLWAALTAAVLFQGSSVVLFTIHVGVGELQHIWWLPLGVLLWRRTRRGGRWASAAGLGLALAAATLSCFYHGLFLGLTVALLSLTTLWAGRETPALLGRYALAAGLGLALVLPVLAAFDSSYSSGEPPAIGLVAYVFEDHGQPVTDPPSARLEPGHLLAPRGELWAEADRQQRGYGGGRYLGILAGLLAVSGLARRPRLAAPFLLVSAAGIVLAMGSYLVVGGEEITTSSGMRYQLPFLYLNRGLGYIAEAVNFPVRFLAMTVTAMAAMAAMAARGRLGPAVFGVALLSVVEVSANELAPRPLETLRPTPYPGLERLAELNPGPVADLSLAWRDDNEVRWASLSAQLAHGQPIHGVPIDRVQFFADDGQAWMRALPLVAELAPALMEGAPVQVPDHRHEESLALLTHAGFRTLLVLGVGPAREVPRSLEVGLTELLGPPVVDQVDALAWPVPDPAVDEIKLRGFIEAHERRINRLAEVDDGPGPQLR